MAAVEVIVLRERGSMQLTKQNNNGIPKNEKKTPEEMEEDMEEEMEEEGKGGGTRGGEVTRIFPPDGMCSCLPGRKKKQVRTGEKRKIRVWGERGWKEFLSECGGKENREGRKDGRKTEKEGRTEGRKEGRKEERSRRKQEEMPGGRKEGFVGGRKDARTGVWMGRWRERRRKGRSKIREKGTTLSNHRQILKHQLPINAQEKVSWKRQGT
jgi:hypothetical protein